MLTHTSQNSAPLAPVDNHHAISHLYLSYINGKGRRWYLVRNGLKCHIEQPFKANHTVYSVFGCPAYESIIIIVAAAKMGRCMKTDSNLYSTFLGGLRVSPRNVLSKPSGRKLTRKFHLVVGVFLTFTYCFPQSLPRASSLSGDIKNCI